MVETPKGRTIIEQRKGERREGHGPDDLYGPLRRVNEDRRRVPPAVGDYAALTMLAQKDARIAELEHALKIIANESQCIDNLMSDKDVARAALAAGQGESK